MKRLNITIGLMAMCSMVTIGAQTPTPQTPQTPSTPSTPSTQPGQMKRDQNKDQTITVSGCVAMGSGAGQYMLNNATRAGDMMYKDRMPPVTPPSSTTPPPSQPPMTPSMKDQMSSPMMSYTLIGGDLKAHVGHKVEVTGTTAMSPGMKGAMGKDRPAIDKDKMPMAKDSMGGTLTVSSVKMISSTCP